MPRALTAFSSLYFATLLMLLGSGLLSTYLGLTLAANGVSELWIGLLMTGYYGGLVMGASVGHRLIARVGHIRAFVAGAGLVTASVLCHALFDNVIVWLGLRVLVGMAMMCQFMVLESWLNEQSESHQRGMVFASYMVVTYLGLVLGQVVFAIKPELSLDHLLYVAMCFSLCLVPVATTRQIHPAPLRPAPLKARLFLQRIPQALTTIGVAGLMMGAFYGMAPVYAKSMGLPTSEIGMFMAVTICAGLAAQWPAGWLSDRIDRSQLIQVSAMVLTAVSVVMAIGLMPAGGLIFMTAIFGLMVFTLYPMAVALANDHVEPDDRVPLSAMLLVTFGLGASVGPLVSSGLMKWLGPGMLYVFMAACSAILVFRVRSAAVTGDHLVEAAPLQFMPAAGNLASSPLAAAIDPRVEESAVIEQMQDEVVVEESAAADSGLDADQDDHRPG
ncbi:MAG: MFS transporter [Pseudomonadota bacterium]|jgi:MFS family permease|uniref:MFS transporter n=1 Tax=Halopseudomonas aestusnigri TaxID=857252 RepID=UPI002E870C55|nr:MFS transporter [Pseudomonadota bacterium]|tara:strand:+ start:6218 stop:7549 length:1332 start_codon:yes stop_codon:yes gene_type:complete